MCTLEIKEDYKIYILSWVSAVTQRSHSVTMISTGPVRVLRKHKSGKTNASKTEPKLYILTDLLMEVRRWTPETEDTLTVLCVEIKR